VPAPRPESNDTSKPRISAITHIPIANWAPRRRSAKNDSGTASRPQASVARNMPMNGDWPWNRTIHTAPYAPNPMNACWPIEISPPYPASAFHMVAISTRIMSDVSLTVTLPLMVIGTKANAMAIATTTPTETWDSRVQRRTSSAGGTSRTRSAVGWVTSPPPTT
jgi:hypothetical protein